MPAMQATGAPNENILAKDLKRHFLLSYIVAELFKCLFL